MYNLRQREFEYGSFHMVCHAQETGIPDSPISLNRLVLKFELACTGSKAPGPRAVAIVTYGIWQSDRWLLCRSSSDCMFGTDPKSMLEIAGYCSIMSGLCKVKFGIDWRVC